MEEIFHVTGSKESGHIYTRLKKDFTSKPLTKEKIINGKGSTIKKDSAIFKHPSQEPTNRETMWTVTDGEKLSTTVRSGDSVLSSQGPGKAQGQSNSSAVLGHGFHPQIFYRAGRDLGRTSAWGPYL